MPDTWTTNPPMLREALKGMGAVCGVEPRVLRPRDPDWTCHLDSAAWQGDVYIHPIEEAYLHSYYVSPLIILFIVGIFTGLAWGRFFWRPRKQAPAR